jgi:hypothetical protein
MNRINLGATALVAVLTIALINPLHRLPSELSQSLLWPILAVNFLLTLLWIGQNLRRMKAAKNLAHWLQREG